MKSSRVNVFEILQRSWPVITFGVAVISAGAIIPFRLVNAEQKIAEVSETVKAISQQTAQITKYIDALEAKALYEHQRIKSAPPGYYWDDRSEQYLPDPEYVPPTKKGHR